MSILGSAISAFAFLGLFAVVEYATYRVMEQEHEKRTIYRLSFILGWTSLALLHMWVIAPWLNLPPTAAVALGLGILAVFIIGGLGAPVLSSIAVIGLYPFALVYELFVLLLLVAEGATLASAYLPIPELLIRIVPSDPQVQAAIGLGVAATVVATLYYDPDGENGYYYAAGHHMPGPTVDYERFKQIKEKDETDKIETEDSGISGSVDSTSSDPLRETSRAPVQMTENEKFEYGWTQSNITFDDVAGYYAVKERLVEEILQPAQAAACGDDRYERFGIEPSRGVLFFGPPGTGKTLFARALAGELEIPFVELGPADVTSKWINEGPQRIRQLFQEGESVGPCVIFLDEAEHLLGGRDVGAGGAHAEDRKITSELLVHLTADDRTAIVVGATNRPEDIDRAILRPGRLATHIEIGFPGEESRHAIFQSKLRGVPHSLTGDQLAQLASCTSGLSGADIEEIVIESKRRAARRDAQAVSIEDFPTPEEFEILTEDISPKSSDDVSPTNDDWQSSKKVFDDDSTVGFQ